MTETCSVNVVIVVFKVKLPHPAVQEVDGAGEQLRGFCGYGRAMLQV